MSENQGELREFVVRSNLPSGVDWRELPCLIWSGTKTDRGYGVFMRGHKAIRVHRHTYEECFGPIPDGMDILHRCDERACRQPLHLFPGTQADNVRDMDEKGRRRNGREARTHCPSGHPYDETNTKHYTNGWRQCRECNRVRAEKARERARQEILS